MVLFPHGTLLQRHQSPLGRSVGRVRDRKQLSLTNPNALTWTFPTGDFRVSVCPQSCFVPAHSHAMGWFPLSWGKLVPLKDGWATTSLPNWKCLRSVWTAVGTIVAEKVYSTENKLDEHTCSHCFPDRCPSVGLAECLATHWSDFKTSSASVSRFRFLSCNSTAPWISDVALPRARCNRLHQI